MKTSTKVIIGSGIVGVAVVLYFMLQNGGAVTDNGFEGKTDFDSGSQSLDDELLNDNEPSQPSRRGGRSNRDGNFSRGESLLNPRRSTENSGVARRRSK